MKLNEIYIRDPFVLADPNSKMYYLYGTTPSYEGQGFYCFKSQDLVDWSGPIKVFTPPSDFWGTKDFWAPEVHMYRGEYYMFATFKGDNTCRGTQILHATSPEGPFNVHSDIITPSDWECLDGTFYVNETGSPYMIFCHEWLQINDGTICALELSDILKHRLPYSKRVMLLGVKNHRGTKKISMLRMVRLFSNGRVKSFCYGHHIMKQNI